MKRVLTTVLGVFAFVGLAMPVSGSPQRVTHGDVAAHFETGEGPGILLDGLETPAATVAAPANFFVHGIRPFPGSPWDGAHYCEEDWHLLVLAVLVPPEDRRLLDEVDVSLDLDSFLLETEVTAIKRQKEGFMNEDLGWWYQQTGAFFGPGELAVGSHQDEATLIVPGVGVVGFGPITIHIDASGTGVCL